MPVTRMSVRSKVLVLAGVLAIAAAGLGVWLWAGDGEGEAKPLSAPAKPCWDGTPSRASLQKLLGPGKELLHEKSEFGVVKDHSPAHCQYEALGDKRLDTVLDMDVAWAQALPGADDPLGADARPGDKPTSFAAGARAYYLRATQRIYFECRPDYPADAPAHLKKSRYVSVDVLARPMPSAKLSAKQAREVGLDMVLGVAHKVADQAGCANDTNLPKSAPQVDEPNWPQFD
ncbi:hypothetical protein OG317_14535 [Streptomyces sp. NBC_01167]|uniref:hypothetical protein n=1 Tax=Streptomyces sp. NBC_01167 TaxID=2903756 RepID=UPI00386FAC7E|nr:hypothetical protein OG317_14535 [Streptomyces sp. NBC_01167]